MPQKELVVITSLPFIRYRKGPFIMWKIAHLHGTMVFFIEIVHFKVIVTFPFKIDLEVNDVDKIPFWNI